MYVMEPEPTSKYLPSLYLRVIDREQFSNIYFIFARQQFGRNFTEAKNTNAKVEELLEAKVSMRSCHIKRSTRLVLTIISVSFSS
jgi:hypothetical protein